MSSNGFPRTPSVFSAPQETLTLARHFCARQVTEGRIKNTDLRDILLALGLDETAQASEVVRPQDLRVSWM